MKSSPERTTFETKVAFIEIFKFYRLSHSVQNDHHNCCIISIRHARNVNIFTQLDDS